MRWLGRWLRGGSDELGWDDLVRRVVDAVAGLAHYGERGRVAFPPDVVVHLEVDAAGVDVVRGFVEKPDFDAQVSAALANRCDASPEELPRTEYVVAAAEGTRIRAVPGSPRGWSFAIEGGDRSGRTAALPPGCKEARFGRGEWHGPERHVRNDLVVCDETPFVSRRAGRITISGRRLDVESVDQGDNLLVRRAGGEVIRPARTARGSVAVFEGDVIELSDGAEAFVRLSVVRAVLEERDGGRHG